MVRMKLAVGDSAPEGGGAPNTSNIDCSFVVPGGKAGMGERPEGFECASSRTWPMTLKVGSNSAPAAIWLVVVVQMVSLWAAIAGSLLKKVPSYMKRPANSSGAR